MLTFYGLGSVQVITTQLPSAFLAQQNERLHPYCFQDDPTRLVGHLLAGVDVAQYFGGRVRLSREEFYQVIWPLVVNCLWDGIRTSRCLDRDVVEVIYRYKKARRIIASDLEPIEHMLNDYFPNLTEGPKLRGAFNQLSRLRGWSNAALITETSGQDPVTNAVIQTQAVYGAKHVADKTRELAARMRSVQLRCGSDSNFAPGPDPGMQFLVVDGDWPVTSKINLLEAGFDRVFEIAQLERLSDELNNGGHPE